MTPNLKCILGIVMIALGLFVGCHAAAPSPDNYNSGNGGLVSVHPDPAPASQAIEKVIGTQTNHLNNIDNHATKIEHLTTEPAILVETDGIHKEVKQGVTDLKPLVGAIDNIRKTIIDIANEENINVNLTKSNKEKDIAYAKLLAEDKVKDQKIIDAESSSKKLTTTLLSLVVVASVVVTGIGVALLAIGIMRGSGGFTTIGIAAGGSAIATAIFAVSIMQDWSQYGWIGMIVGGVVIFGLLATGIIFFIRSHMKLATKATVLQTATTELTSTVQAIKPMLSDVQKEAVFGPVVKVIGAPKEQGLADHIQSQTTQDIVKSIIKPDTTPAK